jgi:prevent-host-death family protein
MADVGIRELKQRLSEYLDRAERGEVLRVTYRGRPKAVLGPVPGRVRIEEGIRAGWISPGTGAPLGRVSRSKAARRVLEVLTEDRGE